MNIAIVDDHPEYQKVLKNYIEESASKLGIQPTITLFNDGLEIVDKYHSSFDIIYFDIEMTMMDGITAAKKIRNHDSQVLIVFVTSHGQAAIRGYEVEAIDFIIKPVSKFNFEEHFKRIVRKTKKNNQSIMVKVSGTMKRVDIQSIVYIESQGHYIDFVTTTEKFTIIDSMKNVSDQLPESQFFRCSNSHIINFMYVDRIDKKEGQVEIKGLKIPISRARKKECIEKFTSFLGGII